MQDLKLYIAEKLDISKDYSGYNYKPKDKRELQDLLEQLIKERGNEGDFNDIDTSLITDMEWLFFRMPNFNGDISCWDTSKVTDMSFMFQYTCFNQDISRWNTSKVTNMSSMFENAKKFNQDISKWDTRNVWNMTGMFDYAESFNQNISKWNVNNVRFHGRMFNDCPIKNSYKPRFK